MFFRVFLVLCAAAAIYAGYEIATAYRYYKIVQTPSADFMVMNKGTGTIPVIQFMDLNLDENKKNNLLLMDYAEQNPDILYMVRPVFRTNDDDQSEVRGLLAAGLQGKYWDLLRLMSAYSGELNDQFLNENAVLIDLDMEKLKKDYFGPEVGEIVIKNRDAVDKSGIKSTQSLMVGRNIYYLDAPLTRADIEHMVGNEK